MFILLCRGEDNQPKWYKFDDGDVSECKMEDDEVRPEHNSSLQRLKLQMIEIKNTCVCEFNFLHQDLFLFQKEMKNQCFGGEYLGEVFDHMLKR